MEEKYVYVEYDELYQAYLDCRKRKRGTVNEMEFEVSSDAELYRLWKDLNSFKYKIGKSIVFCVDKPVKREVFAADFRDRIIHHLVINRINEILENEFINDSYSCRVGKGTLCGIERCEKFIIEASNNYADEAWIMKCDLKSFFMTIDKETLYNKLVAFIHEKWKVEDKRQFEFMDWILKLIIFNEPQKNCIMKQPWSNWKDLPKNKSLFFVENGKGLPIGNLTSQIFANFYLSEFDHFVTDTLGIKYYGRYVDDFFIVFKDNRFITPTLKAIKAKLASMGVILHPKKLYIQEVHKGVNFIGSTIKPHRKYIQNRTKGNLYEMLRNADEEVSAMKANGEEIPCEFIEHFISSLNSYLGFMVHYNTFKIRKKMLTSPLVDWARGYFYTDYEMKKVVLYDKYKAANKYVLSKRYYRLSYLEGMAEAIDGYYNSI